MQEASLDQLWTDGDLDEGLGAGGGTEGKRGSSALRQERTKELGATGNRKPHVSFR